jgi:hypothetical protein
MKLFLIYILLSFFQIKTIFPNFSSISNPYKIKDVISLIKSCKTKEYKIIDPKNYITDEDQKKIRKRIKRYI